MNSKFDLTALLLLLALISSSAQSATTSETVKWSGKVPKHTTHETLVNLTTSEINETGINKSHNLLSVQTINGDHLITLNNI